MTSQSQKALGDHLRRQLPSSAEEQVALDRVWSDLQHEGDAVPAHVEADLRPGRIPRMALAAAAVVVLAAAIGTAILWPRSDTALYRVVDGVVQAGGTIQTNGGGAQLALVDGSRVEMRSQSELSVERADDGLRIRLSKGGIIVNAAEQRTGHLYVQTKDVTVSVVGTVFLVNAGEEGSRVAVVEGEVRVQHGASETTLRPGEDLATSASMETPQMKDAVAWSRNSLALLHQSAVVPPVVSPQNSAAPPETFDVASIRPSRPLPEGMRSGPYPGCTGGPVQIDASRFAATNKTLYHLVTIAYGTRGRGCGIYSSNELVSGGPGWMRSEQFDVEAVIPEGSPGYTARQLADGEAPRIQMMLRSLLADRFGLVLRREVKEMPVYALTVANGGPKYAPATDRPNWIGPDTGLPGFVIDPERQGVFTEAKSPGVLVAWGRKASMGQLASALTSLTGTSRPVLDRTGVAGEFNFDLDGFASFIYNYNGAPQPRSVFTALEEDLGLRLEAATEPVEVLVVEGAERPSAN